MQNCIEKFFVVSAGVIYGATVPRPVGCVARCFTFRPRTRVYMLSYRAEIAYFLKTLFFPPFPRLADCKSAIIRARKPQALPFELSQL